MRGQYQRVGKGLGRRRVLIAALIAALLVVPAALVITQQRAASAATILSILDGTASVARGTSAFGPAADGDILSHGDRVQTAQDSHALVTFFDGSTLEIEPATTVQIEEAQTTASGAISIRIAQTLGRTWASVQKLTRADSKFEIRTPTLTAAVRGTGFITEVLADGTSSVQTTDGTVEVTAQGQSVLVGAGQATTAQPNSPPSAPAPSSTPPNRLRFGMHSPAFVVALDPLGRACGIVLPGPTVVRQIPGCLASEPGTDPQLVELPNAAPGFYRIVIAMTAPGGAFVATASALDGAGALSFNYVASGSGQPGAKFTTGIDVATTANGVLTASGLDALTVIETSPVKIVLGSPTPKPTVSGTPDTSLFTPLPGIGFAAGTNVTPLPVVTTTPLPTAMLPSPAVTILPTAEPTAVPTLIATIVPTPLPTVAPTPLPTLPPTTIPTLLPTLAPTPAPSPTQANTGSPSPTPTQSTRVAPSESPSPSPNPTATPSPSPTATPSPSPTASPTISGGAARLGGTLDVLGLNWSAGATITITWPDGAIIGRATADASGTFKTPVSVPIDAKVGVTYTIKASDGKASAVADVLVQ